MSPTQPILTRRQLLALLGASAGYRVCPTWATVLETGIAPQPYFAEVHRAIGVLAMLGSPIASEDARQIERLSQQRDRAAIEAAERILARYTLLRVATVPDGFPLLTAGGAPRILLEQGWSLFLVRVSNPTAVMGSLSMHPQTGSPIAGSSGAARAGLEDAVNLAPLMARHWLICELLAWAPLSGAAVQYQVIGLYSRDRGRREYGFQFFTSQEPHAYYHYRDSGDYRRLKVQFDCRPSREVRLRVRDADGLGCVAALTLKDTLNRVYPLQAMRLAPDMFFHAHIYRGDGETVRLPDGAYTVESQRGPEYLRGVQTVVIDAERDRIDIQLQRWIDPARWGWYSGDAHLHAAGCAHYERPTEGVSPETMIRHVRGEGLSIGQVLTWGPGWYYQKQFFTAQAQSPPAALEHPELQAAHNTSLRPRPTAKDAESLLRYDVEVSGFPSSHCGHLILLRLQDQDYPGTKSLQDWPSWNLPILRWAKAQGAVVGYAHCGAGMVVDTAELPNYEMPLFESNGMNEALVDVAHGLVDFIAGCDTQPRAELNAWYHMMNCGFRLALIGETDYPCITDERPGNGRTYVRLEERPLNDAGYEAWVRHLQQGRLYCGDGRSHFLDFTVNGHRSGEADVQLEAPGRVSIEALVAARLAPQVPEDRRDPRAAKGALVEERQGSFMNGWHIENARIGVTRDVAVELLVNGVAVARVHLLADGAPRPIEFNAAIAHSSWVALRILPSAHTHPVFVHVAGKPIRASRRSAQWCRSCIDKLWEVKSGFMRESERAAAAAAFAHARTVYEAIARECEVD